ENMTKIEQTATLPAKADSMPRFPTYSVTGQAGTSFKPEHLTAIAAEVARLGFFEVHAENYMAAGRPPHPALERGRRDHPISLPGVSMSLGGPQPLNREHLRRFKTLADRYEPALVSEHLAWSTHENTYLNDLLPLPYTDATLAHVCEHIDEMQTQIGRPILLE